jgi:trigger factor
VTATVRDAGPFEKLISFSVTRDELEIAKTKTARRLSQDLKIRGFRPGKAPRPIVESTVGAERLKSEAIDDLLPEKLETVLTENELNPAITPELSNLDETPDGLDVEVKVTLWPTLAAPPSYEGRTVTVDSPDLSESEIDAQIERIRDQFAELETVERPAAEGDYVSIDIAATADGEDVAQARASQLLYEVGSGGFVEGIDDVLVGASAGSVRTFSSKLPAGFGEVAGREVQFEVTVGEVKAKVLPAVDDDWVADVTEFETVAELRADLALRMGAMKRKVLGDRFRELALDQLVDEVDIELPEGLVRSEMDEVLHRFVHRLESQGISLDDYFRVAGIEQDQFLDDLRQQAARGLTTRIVLESVASAAGVGVTPEEVGMMIEILARQSERPEEFRKAMVTSGRSLSLAGDILRNKALEVIVANSVAVDRDGNQVDLEPEEAEVEALFEVGESGEATEQETVEVVEGEILTGEVVMAEVVADPVVSTFEEEE